MSYRALIPAFPKLYLVSVPESPLKITMSFHREAYTKGGDSMSAQVNAKQKGFFCKSNYHPSFQIFFIEFSIIKRQ